jgi:3-oxoacyl-[acyl-carrier protein] reductase
LKRLGLVTGGTSGIGLAIAKELRAEGHDLLLVYRDRHDVAELAIRSLAEMPGGRIECLAADLTKSRSVEEILAMARSMESSVSVLVNSAGYSMERLFLRTSDGEIDELMSVHVVNLMKLTRGVVEEMYREKFGRIVNFSSVAVKRKRGLVLYATAKAAVEEFTRSLATEVFARGITVNCIRPCLVRVDNEPSPDTVSISDVVDVARFFLSPAGAQTTGSIVDLDANGVTHGV